MARKQLLTPPPEGHGPRRKLTTKMSLDVIASLHNERARRKAAGADFDYGALIDECVRAYYPAAPAERAASSIRKKQPSLQKIAI